MYFQDRVYILARVKELNVLQRKVQLLARPMVPNAVFRTDSISSCAETPVEIVDLHGAISQSTKKSESARENDLRISIKSNNEMDVGLSSNFFFLLKKPPCIRV